MQMQSIMMQLFGLTQQSNVMNKNSIESGNSKENDKNVIDVQFKEIKE